MWRGWRRCFWQQLAMVIMMESPVRVEEGRRMKHTVWTRAISASVKRMCAWAFLCMLLPSLTFVTFLLCINNLSRLPAPSSLKRQALVAPLLSSCGYSALLLSSPFLSLLNGRHIIVHNLLTPSSRKLSVEICAQLLKLL